MSNVFISRKIEIIAKLGISDVLIILAVYMIPTLSHLVGYPLYFVVSFVDVC